MKVKNLINKFSQSSSGTQLAIIALIATWALVLVIIVFGLFFVSFERSSQAAETTPAAIPPAIMVEPATGSIGSPLTVQGQGWPAGSTVSIYLTLPGQTQLPDFATASLVVDQHGQFVADFIFPSEPRWDNQTQAIIVAQADNGLRAEANFQLFPTPEPTETPTSGAPTATPTPPVEPTTTLPVETATPTPTPQPARPEATATANLNVRSGPGLGYPVIGLMLVGQHAGISGTSPDSQWWQIAFPGVAGGQGWVSADYVTAQNTGNVPIVQAPLLPSTPTPTPAPAPVPAITGWRGEYYDNQDLAGSPVLVRNDDTINFNWETGSPGPGLPADNFSVRWSRTLPFTEGWYRFHAIVDDGVRLYVDDVPVIDNWQDGSPHEVIGDQWLSGGDHRLRVEYYEHTGGALIQVWWEPTPAPAAPASPPEADFSANHKSGLAPLHVDFDNRSGGIYDTCEWTFGDGHSSDDCGDTSHTYRNAGTYTVRLKVSGPGGSDTKKKEDYITVSTSVQANFSGSPLNGRAPLNVNFTNLSVGDFDTCAWSFGDGSIANTCGALSHTYPNAGTYSVSLTVSGPGGSNTMTRTGYITVTRPQPAADFTAKPTSGQSPLTVIFTNLSKGNFNTATWAFGDGGTSNDPHNPTYTYTAAGDYTVSLTINGPDGSDTQTKTNYILVNTSPSPTPTMTPTPALTNTPVSPTNTPTPTETPVPPTATPTNTPTPTETPVPPTGTPTLTPTPTETPVPPTATPTNTPTPTETPVPPTGTPTLTPTPTETPVPPTATPTNTPTPTETPVPPANTPTPTQIPVPPTATPTNTPTPTETPVPPTGTPTLTPTPTETPVPSTATPTNTPTPTETPVPPTNTPTPTETPVPPANTPTPTQTPIPPATTPTLTPTPTEMPKPARSGGHQSLRPGR